MVIKVFIWEGVLGMDRIVVPAPAKINLALDIRGVRDDGYHEVEMIMQSISLHDTVIIGKNDGGIRLTNSDPNLPEDENNIAYRAAKLIIDKADLTAGVDIHIKKNIPIAGGLAGGSTDAAAVLVGINKLFNLNITKLEFSKMASKLGSDVPFCVHGGTALAYGRGEKVRQLPDIKRYNLVIINPGIPISTAWAYQEFDKLRVNRKVPIKELINKLNKKEYILWSDGWINVLEEVAISFYPEIKDIKSILKEMGALFVLMSGSGSTVFAIVKDQEKGQNIKRNWPRTNDFITTAWTVKKDFTDLWRKKYYT